MATKFERYEDWNSSGYEAAGILSATWRGQTFTPAVSHTITSIFLYLNRYLNPAGNFNVAIRATSGGLATGANLATGAIVASTVPFPGLSWVEIPLTSLALTAGTQYAIICSCPAGDLDNYIGWRLKAPIGGYAAGIFIYSTDSGANWLTYPDRDGLFQEWGIDTSWQLPWPITWPGGWPTELGELELGCRIAFDSVGFPATPLWDYISGHLWNGSTRRGRQHELDRIEAGTADPRFNNLNGDYWPDNPLSGYYPNVLPGKLINIRTAYNSVSYDIYTGFTDAYQPGFLSRPGKGAFVDLHCVDLQSNLSTCLLNDPTGYPEELSGARINRVLDALGWPSAWRVIDPGISLVQTTGPLVNVNAMQHLFAVQESESGILYVRGDGFAIFEDRHHRVKAPHITSQATFGDDAGEMKYADIEVSYDHQYTLNDLRVTRGGGVEQVATDAASQTLYGPRSLSRSGLLMTTDAQALNQANYLKTRYANPHMRLKSITIKPAADPTNLWPKVLGFDISTRITVRLNQAGLDGDYFIEGTRHDWPQGPINAWTTKWELSKCDPFVFWALGTAGYGELGETTRLFY